MGEDNKLSMITEVGDLGLGLEAISEQDLNRIKTEAVDTKEEK